MATTRKGWRTSVVDGDIYRWMVKREPKYRDNHTRKPMRFIVESDVKSLLVVGLNRPRLDYFPEVGEELLPVTPREVADEIRNAIAEGYNPLVKAKPFTRRCGHG